MLKAIIVDDEQHCVDRITKLLKKYNSLIQLDYTVNTVSKAKQYLEKEEPDIVFLDVQIYEETGFDLLRQLSKINFEIIFTTAYESYAVEAFKFSALDYLLKPIDEEDFDRAIEKIKNKTSLTELSKKMETLFHNLKEVNTSNTKKIALPTLEGLTLVYIHDIIRCQSDTSYVHLYLKRNKKITVAKTLKYFEGLLEAHGFFRTHHSHLINLSMVEKYVKGKGGYVLMQDGSSVEIAVRRKEQFLKQLSGI
ncbi:LytTR family two component transcriptional regulator [Maribacter vaceletii]|uniref:LytTR family two component transcriptional regulator n=1 Tax=Maribacter vaceletii TaxID=1206816 RepID=A0A495DRY4_9FLAO|nr:response regulator transcription factor [Maribacter vaceletii]RKR06491.1 LytTR family two component transcriptional regulator [Maribacter vaceletii]